MTWQVEISAPCVAVSVATRQRDALALKRAANQLSQLGVDTPSLRSWVDYARASYLLLRRRPAQALELLESLLQQHRPEQIGHANIVGLLAQAYNALERFGDAERASGEVLAQLNNDDLAYPGLTLRLQIEHALAIAGLGRHEQAAAQLDALITQHTRSRGPLTLGALHDARASVALRAKQDAVARQHVEHMERWYRSTDCPGLIQHCDRVAKRWETRRSYGRDDVSSPPSTSFLATIGERLTSTQFQESPQELVVQLVRGATAIEGVLAYVAPDGLRHVVQSRDEELPKGLGAWLEQRVNAALSYATESDEAAGNQPVDPNVISLEGQTWRLFLLVSEHGTENPVLGAVALCNPASEVPLDVLRAVAQRLQADSKPVTTRDS
jgi:tetratricopeptide (TPR) repeat protein